MVTPLVPADLTPCTMTLAYLMQHTEDPQTYEGPCTVLWTHQKYSKQCGSLAHLASCTPTLCHTDTLHSKAPAHETKHGDPLSNLIFHTESPPRHA